MNTLKKTLTEEKRLYQELLKNLDVLYSECGEALFKYAQHTGTSANFIAETHFETWQTARESRDKDTETIITIKTAVNRQNELKKFMIEIDKLLHEYTEDRRKGAAEFSILFFQTYYAVCPDYFADIAAEIEPLQAVLKELDSERSLLEEQKITAHFLQKLSINTQLTIIKTKYTSAQKKIEKKVSSRAEALISNPQFSALYNNRQLQELLCPLYQRVHDFAAKIAESEQRKTALLAENNTVEMTLAQCGVTDNATQRITELTNRIKELDTIIYTAEKEQGLYASRIFYPDTAEQSIPLPDDSTIQTYLQTIREQSAHVKTQECTVAYIENEITISEETTRVDNLKKAIANYEQRITEYQRMIEKAHRDIAQAEETKALLQKNNAALKPESESSTV